MIFMTLDTVELYRRATEEFAARVRLVGIRWTAATPCSDWDVRALVRHVVEEELWVPPLFAGRTIAEVGDSLSGDLLGDDPVRVFEHASAAAIDTVREPGALELTVHLSFGDFPCGGYAISSAPTTSSTPGTWPARSAWTPPWTPSPSRPSVPGSPIGRMPTDPVGRSGPECRCRMGLRRRTTCWPGLGGHREPPRSRPVVSPASVVPPPAVRPDRRNRLDGMHTSLAGAWPGLADDQPSGERRVAYLAGWPRVSEAQSRESRHRLPTRASPALDPSGQASASVSPGTSSPPPGTGVRPARLSIAHVHHQT